MELKDIFGKNIEKGDRLLFARTGERILSLVTIRSISKNGNVHLEYDDGHYVGYTKSGHSILDGTEMEGRTLVVKYDANEFRLNERMTYISHLILPAFRAEELKVRKALTTKK